MIRLIVNYLEIYKEKESIFHHFHSVILSLLSHTYTHCHMSSLASGDRSHFWRKQNKEYLDIHAETPSGPLLTSPSVCLILLLPLALLFVTHLYFSTDCVHGNSEVSLQQVMLTFALSALQVTLT